MGKACIYIFFLSKRRNSKIVFLIAVLLHLSPPTYSTLFHFWVFRKLGQQNQQIFKTTQFFNCTNELCCQVGKNSHIWHLKKKWQSWYKSLYVCCNLLPDWLFPAVIHWPHHNTTKAQAQALLTQPIIGASMLKHLCSAVGTINLDSPFFTFVPLIRRRGHGSGFTP